MRRERLCVWEGRALFGDAPKRGVVFALQVKSVERNAAEGIARRICKLFSGLAPDEAAL
jgi:hypothetical protein